MRRPLQHEVVKARRRVDAGCVASVANAIRRGRLGGGPWLDVVGSATEKRCFFDSIHGRQSLDRRLVGFVVRGARLQRSSGDTTSLVAPNSFPESNATTTY